MRPRYLRAGRFAAGAGLGLALACFAAGLRAEVLALSGAAFGASLFVASAFGVSALAASGFVSDFVSGLTSLLASSLSGPARLRCLSLSDLKSVSYQPEPFNRNTGAD